MIRNWLVVLAVVGVFWGTIGRAAAAPGEVPARGARWCLLITNDLYEIDHVRSAVEASGPALDACYAGHPVDRLSRGHQVWSVSVASDGKVIDATYAASPGPFDACVNRVWKKLSLGATRTGQAGEIRIGLVAKT